MNKNKKEAKVSLAQIRVYKRLMPEMKILGAKKGWSIVETASVLIAEALNTRKVNQAKVNAVL